MTSTASQGLSLLSELRLLRMEAGITWNGLPRLEIHLLLVKVQH